MILHLRFTWGILVGTDKFLLVAFQNQHINQNTLVDIDSVYCLFYIQVS